MKDDLNKKPEVNIFEFVLKELRGEPSALANKEDFIYIENIIKTCQQEQSQKELITDLNLKLADSCIYSGQMVSGTHIKHGFGV